MRLTKRKIAIFIGIPISLLFLYLAVRQVDFSKTIQVLAETNYLFLIPAAIVFIFDFSLRAFRWKIMLDTLKKCRFIDVLSVTFIGFFANAILPMRAGEIIRILLIGEKEKISRASATATIILERSLDVFMLFSLLFATFLIFPYPEAVKKICLLGLFLFIAVLLLLCGLMYYRSITLKILTRFFKILPGKIEHKIEHLLESFIDGLEILKKPRQLLMTILISIAVWLLDASVFFFIAKGMGIHQVTYPGAVFLVVVIAFGIAIPSSPGFIGVYEYFGILACGILGVAKNTALSFILLVHAFQFITMTAMGMFFLAREHISLIQLERKAEKEVQ